MDLIQILLGPLADGRFWVSILPMLPVAGLVGLAVWKTSEDRDRARNTLLIAISAIVLWTGSQYLTFLGRTDSAVGEIANLIQGHGWELSVLLASSWWILTVWGVDRRRAGPPIGQFSRTGFHWVALASSPFMVFLAVLGLLASVGGWDAWHRAIVIRGLLASGGEWGDWYQFVVFVFGPSQMRLMLGARPGFLTAKGVVRPVDGFIPWDRISSYELSRMRRGSRLKIHVERSRWSPFRPWHIHRPTTTWRVADESLPQVQALLEGMVGPSGDVPRGADMNHDASASS